MKSTKVIGTIAYVTFLLMILACTYLTNEPTREYNKWLNEHANEMKQQFCPYCGNELNEQSNDIN